VFVMSGGTNHQQHGINSQRSNINYLNEAN
jgi:hypothetical protein